MTKDELVHKIFAYELGDLSDEAMVELFQELVSTSLAWVLQGHYGRTAKELIDAGVIVNA